MLKEIVFVGLLAFFHDIHTKAISSDIDTLVQVHLLFRHGNITPKENTYPTDPYANLSYFPMGHSELTNDGKRVEYRLGEELRKNYDAFLGAIYTPGLINARSTSTDRTKMSLALVLASLFPPKGEQQWNEELNWQPIPFDYSSTLDKELSGRYCPNFEPALEEVYATEEYNSSLSDYKEVFDYISTFAGGDFHDFEAAYDIYNVLFVQKSLGLILPNWTETVYPEPLMTMAEERFKIYTGNDDLKKMISGFLLQKIINDSNLKLQDDISEKLFLYSAHKTNVGTLLNTLGIFDPQIPPYGSYVAFEVHSINETSFMKILYQNYTEVMPHEMAISGCEVYCPLEEFTSLVEKYFPDDFTCGD